MDNKKYYYMRLKEDYFDNPKIVVLESMKDGYLFSNILLKMYLLSLKTDGRLMVNNVVPYNAEMLSAITRHQVGTVERALKAFEELDLIEVMDQGAIYMTEIQTLIGKTSTEADRIRNFRNRIDEEKGVQMYEKCTPEIRDKRIENREQSIETIDKDIKDTSSSNSLNIETPPSADRTPYSEVMKLYNSICTSFKRAKALSADRRKHIKARFNDGYTLDDFETLFKNAEASSWLKTWRGCDLDWLITDKYMPRVLEGKYRDRDSNDSVSHNASDPVRIDFQRYRDADGEFSVSFETLGNGRKKMTMSYDSGLTKVLEYDNDTRPTWLQ